MAKIELEQDIVDAAAARAAEHGLSLTEYVSLLLRRSFERASNEDSVLAYDSLGEADTPVIDREPGETDADYERRSALYRDLFGRR
jgi:hypothetical protein